MSEPPVYDVFISAVSSEFETARDAVANGLSKRGLRVRIQPEFPQGATTTLAKLHDFIKDCNAVVAVVGVRSGAFPAEQEAAPYAHMLEPYGLERASYTQWEVIFALHYQKTLWIHVAEQDYPPEREPGDGENGETQQRFREVLFRRVGLDRTEGFNNADRLEANVLQHDLPDHSRPKPISRAFETIGSLFKGREGFLEELRETLGDAAPLQPDGPAQAAAIVDKTVVHGLGGVGKTRAAIEYGLRHQAHHNALLFVTAESPEALEANLAALTGSAHLALGLEEAETAARVKAVLDWLAVHPGWFLVIDNADTREAAAAVQAVLGELRGGKVLITSRYANWGPTVRRLEIDVIAPDAAVDYLMEAAQSRAVTADDAVDAAALAERLGWLSLALAQAAAFIDRYKISFAAYRERWETQRASVNARFGTLNLDYPLSVAATWATTFEQLTPDARTLLGLLAQLSIEPIPRSLLAVLPDDVLEEAEAEDALIELADFSLANITGNGKSLTVHRAVQEVTRDEQEIAGTTDAALGAALGWLKAATEDTAAQDVRDWPVLDPLLPHALAALDRGADTDEGAARAYLLNKFGSLLRAKGQYGEAEPLYRHALAIAEAQYGPDNPEVASTLNNLAGLLRATNRLDEAEPKYRRALAMDKTKYGPEHPAVARDLNNLALLLHDTDRSDEAEPLYRRALAIDENAYGPDHPEVATDLNNLALLLNDTDRLAEAESLFRRALAIDENAYGPDHPEVATDLNNLALLLRDSDHLAEAEPLLRRALAIDKAHYGPDHPKFANRLNNLAKLLRATKRGAEAEPLFHRALGIFLKSSAASGHSLPNLDVVRANYARALSELGRSEAEISETIATLYHEAGLPPPDG